MLLGDIVLNSDAVTVAGVLLGAVNSALVLVFRALLTAQADRISDLVEQRDRLTQLLESVDLRCQCREDADGGE